MELPSDAPQPRLCHLIKWPDFDGYGFNLHAEKAKTGQFIGKVDDDSPAQAAGLCEGDRIIEVNMVNIANENHRQVVERIKAVPNETKLLVIDDAADRWYKERKLVVKSNQANVLHFKTPESRTTTMKLETVVMETDPSPPPSPHTKMNGDNKMHDHEVNGMNNHNHVQINHVNGSSVREESPILENGAISSRSSTPQSHTRTHGNNVDMHNNVEIHNNRPSSSGSNANTSSIPGSPTSTKSGSSNGVSRSLSENGEINLNMTASQMRQLLAQRKKHDAKKAQIDLRQKYDIIQQM